MASRTLWSAQESSRWPHPHLPASPVRRQFRTRMSREDVACGRVGRP